MEDKDTLTEILIKLARIEENTKGLDETDKKAVRALGMAHELQRQLNRVETNNKWSWGFIISLGITIIGYFLIKV
ncbi:hemolysin XhlA family protein [Brochothrix thermosphacta]|uniref:hemolysin XhlA family protein n=1 Tax=Brochothrix thermosphacta TaxID=2756 RepID=UPI0039B0F0FD